MEDCIRLSIFLSLQKIKYLNLEEFFFNIVVWICYAPVKKNVLVLTLVYEFPLNWRFWVLNSMLGWDVGEHDEKLKGF
jgi:hypothetical protein